jgi:hypothetical protein
MMPGNLVNISFCCYFIFDIFYCIYWLTEDGYKSGNVAYIGVDWFLNYYRLLVNEWSRILIRIILFISIYIHIRYGTSIHRSHLINGLWIYLTVFNFFL